MEYTEDHIALAAEYALGTLDADERGQVETMMSADKDFTNMVRAWEYRLGVLNQMVGSVEPRPEVWDRIKSAAGLSEPQAPPVPEQTSEAAPSTVDNANVVRLADRAAQRWRGLATAMAAIAAVLVALIGVQIAQPDWLPQALRPKPRTQIVEVKVPPSATPASAQYVALLQGQ